MENEKYTVFRSPQDDQVHAIRNVPPRFTVRYVVGADVSNNIEIIDIQDEWDVNPIKIAKLMRGIGEAIARFLQSESRKR